MNDFDFAVIGGGSAGYAAARTAAEEGLRTVVIDGSEELGGLCILRGCMPSKTLIESGNRLQDMREAATFGLTAGTPCYDAEKIIERKRRLIADFANYRAEQLESGKFELIRGYARFVSSYELQVSLRDGGEQIIHARTILVATGSHIHHLGIPGLKEAAPLTSDDVLDNAHPPKSLLVLGAGPVALELAHYHRALGAEVTVIQRSKHILSSMDFDVADAVQKGMEHYGIKFFLGCKILTAGKSPHRKWIRIAREGREETLEADEILLALGRRPNTEKLELSHAELTVPAGAPLTVSHTQQTAVPTLFGAGDVTGELEIVHVAIEQGEVAARNAARLLRESNEPLETMDYRLRLFVVFTDPEAAMVGLTEREAAAAGRDVVAASYPFSDHGKSIIHGKTQGFVKLLADRTTGELLGGAVVGPQASELIHEVTVALRFRATAAEFARIPHYHPTLSEIWTYPAEELALR